ncbi:MAG: 2-oxo acid dehydrogenase subunit E2 [Bifidobacteriaceae bacterium]|nr:2-oxo acid dehydrogenase subunit E2 [Bifidobacteriaceae bacterium]
MLQEVLMPALGESVTEGTVSAWLKQVGQTVALDEPLLEISTDKVDTELPSPAAGVVLRILAQVDDVVTVGQVLAVIGQPSEVPEADQGPAVPPADTPPPSVASPFHLSDAVPPAARPEPSPAAPEPSPAAPQPGLAAAEPGPVTTGPSLVSSQPSSAAPEPSLAAAEPFIRPIVPLPAPPAIPATLPATAPAVVLPEAGRTASSTPYTTPIVRKLAAEHGVDLATVTGSGVGGRIRREDVLAAVPPPAPAPPTIPAPVGTGDRLPRLRAIIAQREPHDVFRPTQLTSVAEVDVTEVVRLTERGQRAFLERDGIALEYDPFFALATVEALKANPVFNAAISQGDVTYYGEENLGVTVFTPSGPLVPVIPDAGSLGLVGLARAIAGVKARASAGALLPADLAAGTFTMTAPAGPDLMLDFPIIEVPQVAVLSVGAVTCRPVVLGEGIAVRSTSYLALSYDSRLITPSDAAHFLSTIKARLEPGDFSAQLGL